MSMALYSEQIVLVDPGDLVTSYDLALANATAARGRHDRSLEPRARPFTHKMG